MSLSIGVGMGGGGGAFIEGDWCCKVEEIGEEGDERIGFWESTGMIEVWGKGTSIDMGVMGGKSGVRKGED